MNMWEPKFTLRCLGLSTNFCILINIEIFRQFRDIKNSLHLERKCAPTLSVPSREQFPREKFDENCELRGHCEFDNPVAGCFRSTPE